MGRYGVSERRATAAARFCLSSIRYHSCRDPLTALRQRLREVAQTRVRFGSRRLLVLLRREGWALGKKRCYRLYTEEGLTLRRKRPWRQPSGICRKDAPNGRQLTLRVNRKSGAPQRAYRANASVSVIAPLELPASHACATRVGW